MTKTSCSTFLLTGHGAIAGKPGRPGTKGDMGLPGIKGDKGTGSKDKSNPGLKSDSDIKVEAGLSSMVLRLGFNSALKYWS